MVYLDYNATAPVRPQALDATTAALGSVGNRDFLANQVVFSAQQGVPNPNRYAVTHFNLPVPKPAPVYAADLAILLGDERPQVTPFVTPSGTVRGTLIEMNIGSSLFTDLTALLLGP